MKKLSTRWPSGSAGFSQDGNVQCRTTAPTHNCTCSQETKLRPVCTLQEEDTNPVCLQVNRQLTIQRIPVFVLNQTSGIEWNVLTGTIYYHENTPPTELDWYLVLHFWDVFWQHGRGCLAVSSMGQFSVSLCLPTVVSSGSARWCDTFPHTRRKHSQKQAPRSFCEFHVSFLHTLGTVKVQRATRLTSTNDFPCGNLQDIDLKYSNKYDAVPTKATLLHFYCKPSNKYNVNIEWIALHRTFKTLPSKRETQETYDNSFEMQSVDSSAFVK